MFVESILRFHVRMFLAVGLFPIEICKKGILMTKKSIVLCSISFVVVNIVLVFALIKILLHPTRYYWTLFSRTANIFRVLMMLALFLSSIVINFWIIFHSPSNLKALKEIFEMLKRIQSMGSKTCKYNRMSRDLCIGLFVDGLVFSTSFIVMLFIINIYKIDPDLFIEGVEFLQRIAAEMTIKYFICCILSLSYCLTCINDELLGLFVKRDRRRLKILMRMFVKVEPVCEELNRIFGLPIAILFCTSFATILNTTLYAHTIFFTNWALDPVWHMYASFGASVGLMSPVAVGLIYLCVVNARLRKEVSI